MSGPDFEHEELRARRENIEALRDNLREASVWKRRQAGLISLA